MDIDYEALLQTFLVESEESFGTMEEALVVLEKEPQNDEALAGVFRVAHTLKGTAAMFEFTGVERFGHAVEELLVVVRQGAIAASEEVVSLLFHAIDALRRLIAEAVAGRHELPADVEGLLHRFEEVVGGVSAMEVPPGGPRFEAESSASLSEEYPEETTTFETQPTHGVMSLRVGLDKLDRLLDLVGEIKISRDRLARVLEVPGGPSGLARDLLSDSDGLQVELQQLVMQLRMVPLGPTFRRYRRVVRDLARARDKSARLVIEGEDVEVDAAVIEGLRDPLTHMVRNAVDHGVETPAKRRAAGKDPTAIVRLSARHEAGSIVVELSDDGAGIDWQEVVERARQAGLVEAEQSLTEAEKEQLVFEPGLSTAERVTEISGRGVGMDVVRRSVEALRGSITVSSASGAGTVLTLRVPLTLAVIEGLAVRVAEESFFIPIDSVIESVELPGPAWQRTDRQGVIDLRGEAVPWVRLRSLFDLEGELPERENVVVVERHRKLAGLVVDDLISQGQAVIKPLSKLFSGLPGISASTILGDGKVALILDVAALLLRAQKMATEAGWMSTDRSSPAWPAEI
ncbi:MAG: chemotaxis protein CheA [Acidobacteriota bacterium]